MFPSCVVDIMCIIGAFLNYDLECTYSDEMIDGSMSDPGICSFRLSPLHHSASSKRDFFLFFDLLESQI